MAPFEHSIFSNHESEYSPGRFQQLSVYKPVPPDSYEKKFQCSLCDFRTKTFSLLKNHIFNKHERPKDAKAEHRCPDCNKTYHHKSALGKHMRYECGVEPQFKCEYCQRRFKQKIHLLTHIKTLHEPNNPS